MRTRGATGSSASLTIFASYLSVTCAPYQKKGNKIWSIKLSRECEQHLLYLAVFICVPRQQCRSFLKGRVNQCFKRVTILCDAMFGSESRGRRGHGAYKGKMSVFLHYFSHYSFLSPVFHFLKCPGLRQDFPRRTRERLLA